jgi:transposase
MAAPRLATHQKGARQSGRVIAFLDETGFTFRARVATTWAPAGCAPVLKRLSKRREVSSLIALTAPLDGTQPRLYARHFLDTIHGEEVIVGLRYFRARIGRPLIIVWDHLAAHRARIVTDFVARHPADFRIEWLPGYAPELNPEEPCNNAVKLAMVNATPESIDALRALARVNFVRLGRKPQMLEHFFQYAGLSVK